MKKIINAIWSIETMVLLLGVSVSCLILALTANAETVGTVLMTIVAL